MAATAFFGRDPEAIGPGRIVPHVLAVAAFQFRDPIVVFVQMKSGNFPPYSNYFFGHIFLRQILFRASAIARENCSATLDSAHEQA